MIEHLVLFKLREGWTSEDADTLKQALLGMQEHISGIEYASAGLDFSGRSRGYDFGYIARFGTRDAYELYGPHPAHSDFIAANKHLWTEVLALDYEV